MSGGHFWDQEKGATAGFPMHGFICCRPTTNRFPQLIYYWRLLCCMQNFPLDYVSCLLSRTDKHKYPVNLRQTTGLFLQLEEVSVVKPSLNVKLHSVLNEHKHTHTNK